MAAALSPLRGPEGLGVQNLWSISQPCSTCGSQRVSPAALLGTGRGHGVGTRSSLLYPGVTSPPRFLLALWSLPANSHGANFSSSLAAAPAKGSSGPFVLPTALAHFGNKAGAVPALPALAGQGGRARLSLGTCP